MKKGFTLVEIIIVIFIITIVALMTYVGFRYYTRGLEIRSGVQIINKALVEVKSRTIASKGASRWGVHFDENQYVIYKVDLGVNPDEGYNSASADNEVHTLSKNIELCEINLQTISAEAVFGVYYQYLDGINDKISGTVKVCDKNDNSRAETITIERQGSIETETPSLNTIESRHLHFQINQDVTNTSVLRLNFTSDSVVKDIAFQNYYYEGEFNWSDIIVVNGQEQRLKIHSHSLDASSVLLCIHRDERFNTKPLTISLRDINGDGDTSDSLEIVSYQSNTTATKGSSSDILMYVQ